MLKIVFEDDYLLVIDKPPGLVVTSSETQDALTLQDILRDEYQLTLDRSGILHRLDKDTSGLLMVAKTQEAFDMMKLQFKERKIHKEYLALVHGFMKEVEKLETLIGRQPGNREKFAVISPKEAYVVSEGLDEDFAQTGLVRSRQAITNFKPVELLQMSQEKIAQIFAGFNKIQLRKIARMNYQNFSLVACFPQTGRTHQIRVHLKYLGFPIVADQKYGGRKVTRLDLRWCSRQFLHAFGLKFVHPITGVEISLEAPLADDLKKSLTYLNILNG